ncbi:MAG: 23S rRNA (uracil(1939)-C(5))-methyltransferase RlmD [Bacilli bacterium]|nr:23S rRNA (uracil(1939)-C(5))-methyltransferase RlmD [Bacilli bacterium]
MVKCERLDHFGRGICYLDKKIVFVRDLLPAEEAEVKIIKTKKKFSEGEVLFIKKKSPDRVFPKCPYNNCGCQLKHMDYKGQLAFKENKVKDILKRYADIDCTVNKIISSDHIYGYRNKVTLKVKNGVLGFYLMRTNDIIEIKECALVSPLMNKIIGILNTMDLSDVSEVVIKEFDGIMVFIKGNADTKLLESAVQSIYVNDKLIYGKEFIETSIDNLTFKVSPVSFFQVNKYMISKLYEIALKYVGNDYDKKILDLYCGTGTITLLLSKYFKEVIGVEINKESIKCANINKKINGIDNVQFICADASEIVESLDADIVVVDPPRSGLTNKAIKDILRIGAEKIIYISCDPMTLARDLKVLSKKYEVREVTPVDMFPNTYHVESVTLLERK